MSMKITMNNEYTQITTYDGKLNDKYPFTVKMSYDSEVKDYHIVSVNFDSDGNLYNGKSKRYWIKAEDRVKDFITKSLFIKPEAEE
tara:strand:- start:3971 stop:4228 length:258 start_codon:yes stop_codon:yes gene_type:complete